MLFNQEYNCATKDFNPDVNCLKCGLYKRCKHPKMEYTGNGKKKCLIIAEAPGEDEDNLGRQLVGKIGQWFRKKLAAFDLSLDDDFYKTNSVCCRPTDPKGNNRKPTPQEIQYCRPRIEALIKKLKPEHIWLMGGVAIESFYGRYFDSTMLAIGKWRRHQIPDPEWGAYILPLFHPSYLVRQENDQNLQSTYIHDLSFAVSHLQDPPFKPLIPTLDVVTDFERIHRILELILDSKPPVLYFDYETNCLKPMLPGAKVASISFSCDNFEGVAIPYQYPNVLTASEQLQVKDLWSRILKDPKIKKAAHSCQFENNWSCKHFAEPVNWHWDTQLAAHVLDNRRAVYSLKFQSLVKLGFKPYNLEVSSLLEPKGKNKFNHVFDIPLEKLLTYNAMDSFCGRHLMKRQTKEFKADKDDGGRLFDAYHKFFLKGAIALSDMERAGIRTNTVWFQSQKKKIEENIEETKKKILCDPAAVKFRKQKGRIINIKKNVGAEDLRYLLETVLRVPVEKFTATDLIATDSEVLTRLTKQHKIIRHIIDLRSDVQILKTYLQGYLDWAIDGFVYPNINLYRPTSYRSSASNPNIQNVPKRSIYIRELVRRGIVARIGRQLGEADFSGIEVAVGCCYHKDPKMISYLTVGGDMHRDAACDIWLLPAEEISKMIRFFLKNQWVFPQFYGSIYINCARGLWENSIDLETTSGEPLKEHMRLKGITNLDEFTEHLKECENTLWHRFKVYKKWKDQQQADFRRDGYLESFLGFKYSDYMGYNEASNYPIQGTAFHLLLWTYIQVNAHRREEKWRTKIPAEIHDSMLFDFHPKEVPHVIKTVKQIAEVQMPKTFDWINVPIKIETEIAPVGGSWHEIEPYHV